MARWRFEPRRRCEARVIGQSELRRQEYVGRINRITDYVREKIAGNLRLKTLARVTSVSP